MIRSRTMAAVTFLVGLAVCARADRMDALVSDLAGSDDHARTRARQLLPRYGLPALESLLPLLGHENGTVQAAAFNVIEDIANESASPGRDADRTGVVELLTTLLGPHQSVETKTKSLRLLPLVVPDDWDVSPIVAMLQDPALGEKARAALQHIGTRRACLALLDAVPQAEPHFACALLHAVGGIWSGPTGRNVVAITTDAHPRRCHAWFRRRPRPSARVQSRKASGRRCVAEVEQIALTHPDAAVRAAALRALAHSGDPSLLRTFRQVRHKAATETEFFDVTDALLLLAENMAERGGNWDVAISVYCEVLDTTSHGVLKSAALEGLGRFGDETVVETIVVGARDADPRLQASAVSALERMRGRAASERMAAAYERCGREMRPLLLAMFGRRGDPVFLPVLQTESGSENPVVRRTALGALGELGLMDALPVLVEAVRSGTPEEQALALDGALRVAALSGAAGDAVAAGKALLKLYGLAQTDDVRIKALEGLATYPVPEAFDEIMRAYENESLKAAALAVLPGLFAPLVAVGQEDKALQVFAMATRSGSSLETLLRMASGLQSIASKLDTTQLLGVIRSWRVIGPFPWTSDADWERPFIGEPNVSSPAASISSGETVLSWRDVCAEGAIGSVDLTRHVAQQDRCFAYAYAEIQAPQGGQAQIRIGSDDGNMVWLNGKRVWDNRVDRSMVFDQDIVNCVIRRGINRILVKISQGAGGWGFCLRITRPDGTAFPFVQTYS